MTNIDTNRSHSSTLNAKSAAHAAYWDVKGFASVKSGTRALAKKGLLARIEADGLAAHFAFVTLTEGKHAGRVIATLGFEAGSFVTPVATGYCFHGIQVITAG